MCHLVGQRLAPRVVAGRQIVDDQIAGDRVHRARLGDVFDELPDDDTDLGFVVELAGETRMADRRVVPDRRMRRGLEREKRLGHLVLGDRLTAIFVCHLVEMIAVIAASRKYRAGIKDRRVKRQLRKRKPLLRRDLLGGRTQQITYSAPVLQEAKNESESPSLPASSVWAG